MRRFGSLLTAIGVVVAGLSATATVTPAHAVECVAMDLAHFGDVGGDSDITLGPFSTDCRTLTLTAGTYIVNDRFNENWRIENASNEEVCTADAGAICVISSSGDYSLIRGTGTGSVQFRTKVLALADTTNCATTTPTTWAASSVAVTLADRQQLLCRTIDLPSGSGIFYRTYFMQSGWIDAFVTNAEGQELCTGNTSWTPCSLTGTAPYRLVINPREPSGSLDIEFSVRATGEGSDCPELSVADFGSVVSDPNSSVLCRKFEVGAGHRLAITSFKRTTSFRHDFRLYDPNMNRICIDSLYGSGIFCRTATEGWHTVLLFEPSRVAVYDVNAGGGCVSTPLSVSMVTKKLSVGQVRCAELQTSGEAQLAVFNDNPDALDPIPHQIWDSTGELQCWLGDVNSVDSCDLTGTPPFRATYGNGAPLTARIGFADSMDSSCPDVTVGANNKVSIASGQFVACVLMPAADRANPEWNRLQRTSLNGTATFAVFAAPEQAERTGYPTSNPTSLTELPAVDAVRIFIVSATGGKWKYLHDPFGEATPVWVMPSIPTPVKGTKITVKTGQWYVGTSGVNFSYQWYLDGVPIANATSKSITVKSTWGGSLLFARVTGKASGLDPTSVFTKPKNVVN